MKALITTLITLTNAVLPVISATNLNVSNQLGIASNYHSKSLSMIAKSLLEISDDHNVILTIKLGATYGEINKAVYNTATVFKAHPLLDGYQVDYYRNKEDTSNINNEGQITGDVYVVITAAQHDPYWKGKTDYLPITIQKAKLEQITTLTGLSNIEVKSNEKYQDINPSVFNQASEFATNPLADGFTVHYFSDQEGTIDITNNEQVAGDVYVKITAAANDPYWTGTTAVIKVTLTSNKTDLNSLSQLEMPEIKVVYDQTNQQIDSNIFNQAKEFALNPLADGFTVHYFSDKEGTIDITNNEQVGGDIYVKITAAANDPYWTGTSLPLKLTLTDERIDLNTISDLTGMDPIIVNPNLTYQAINKNVINTANQLKNDPLTGDFVIHYFSDIKAKHAIDHHYQQVGTVYVIISPDYHTPTKWKANQKPIAFTIVQ